MKSRVPEVLSFVTLIGTLCVVHSSPVKVSRPQAITPANLTQSQVQTSLQENPTRPSILQAPAQLPPSIPLYLPDPERNKSQDDSYLFETYLPDGKSDENAQPLALFPFMQPPPIPSPDQKSVDFNIDQVELDKPSYSYNNRYDYYFPMKVEYDDEHKYAGQELELMEMQPPKRSDEPNYYAVKPKKVPKKYQPNRKDFNHNKFNGRDDTAVAIDNDGLMLNSEHTPFVTSQPVERFVPSPTYRELSDADLNTGEYIPKYKSDQNTEPISASDKSLKATKTGESIAIEKRPHESGNDQSDGNKRVEFQMHGFDGPNSYKFGFDTGLGGRQFRIEQREADGSVSGRYGFIDDEGKMHLTKYRASVDDGFQAEDVL